MNEGNQSAIPVANFADMLQLAAEVCNLPMALVTSYDGIKIRVEHQHGFHGRLPAGFCAYAIQQDTMLEVADAVQDDRFTNLPEVQEEPFIRFYVGAPLVCPNGVRLGTLALMDSQPRTLSAMERQRISTLAHQVMVIIALRRQHSELQALAEELDRTNCELRAQAEHLRQAQHIAKVGSWKYEIEKDSLQLSDQILHMYGITAEQFGGTMQDFVNMVHPDDRDALRLARDTAVNYGHGGVQCRVTHADGKVRTVQIIGQLFCRPNEDSYLAGTTQDITEQKATEERIRQLAYYDQLTGLPNRQYVLDRINHIVGMRSRTSHDAAVLFIDLDNFKTLNDMHGHDKGDMLLQQVAYRLRSCVRQYDCVGRFGGDEFIVLLEQVGEGKWPAATHALQVAQKILASLNEPYVLETIQHRITPSIGIAVINGEQITTGELLKRADMAMYKAKSEGRNAVRFFNPQMQEAVVARAELEADLRQAFAEKTLHLDYQPQVDASGHIRGVEVLLRWDHPKRGRVPPIQFIPVAEELGLIVEMGRWLLIESCQQLAKWASAPILRDVVLSVNVSMRQFHHPSFVEHVKEALLLTGADPNRLKIEITESMLVSDFEDTKRKMLDLKAVGVRFALDDFGTGYSSLAYLQRLPLDQLKIDQSFISHVDTNGGDAAITRSIIALAHSLNLSVIAEGVETEGQRRFLSNEGCREFQGFLYHKPLTVDALEAWVSASNRMH